MLGPRLLVAFVAGVGVAALAFFALSTGIQPFTGGLLLIVYLLFTSNTTICLPEHFGITNGILTLSFVASAMMANQRRTFGLLGLSALVLWGTSMANALFPLGRIFDLYVKPVRMKLRLLGSGVLLALAGLAGWHSSRRVGAIERLWAGWRRHLIHWAG